NPHQNPEVKTPITIGVYGQWGSGQILFDEKIKELLSKASGQEIILASEAAQPTRPTLRAEIGKTGGYRRHRIQRLGVFQATSISGRVVTHLYRGRSKNMFGLRTHVYRLSKAARACFRRRWASSSLRHSGCSSA
ncbi:MAG: hypothetical protein IPG44_06475, partial [Anaerolineales bacterium]|nr:hypothetical protein [Anaerolineales bacterium]